MRNVDVEVSDSETSGEPGQSPERPVPLGRPVKLKDATVTLLAIKDATPEHRGAVSLTPASERRGKRRVRLRFKVENRASNKLSAEELPNASIIDTRGRKHRQELSTGVFLPALNRDIQPGRSRVGYAGVLVPKRAGVKLGQFQYQLQEGNWKPLVGKCLRPARVTRVEGRRLSGVSGDTQRPPGRGGLRPPRLGLGR